MNFLENNPIGKGLAWTVGGLAVISLMLVWAWSWPVTKGVPEAVQEDFSVDQSEDSVNLLGDISEYQVVNDRPVFNASRQPVVLLDDGEGEIQIEDGTVAIAPDVRLTGVIITPDQRIATLTSEGKDPLIAFEGKPLDGEYVGWMVASIEPRKVRLESIEGESLEIELMVHDQVIAEPPKPLRENSPEGGEIARAGGAEGLDENGKPMSRADEIRRRIQERREQLRAEAEEAEQGSDAASEQGSEYQQAIQSMLQRSNNPDNNTSESGPDDD